MESLNRLFYHPVYELMQPLGFMGRWDLSRQQHVQAVSEVIGQGRIIKVLYAGTATARNPIDAANAFRESGYDPKMTVVDLAKRPLKKVDRKGVGMSTCQTDIAQTDFTDGVFDVITSDFLLNMNTLDVNRGIVSEMARILSSKGVISMTAFIKEDFSLNRQTLFSQKLGRYFETADDWQKLFLEHGLDLKLRTFYVGRKPFLYPSGQFTHIIATKG